MTQHFSLCPHDAKTIIDMMEENGRLSPALLMRRLKISAQKAKWIENEITTIHKLKQHTQGDINV